MTKESFIISWASIYNCLDQIKMDFVKKIIFIPSPTPFLSLFNVKKMNNHQAFQYVSFLQNQYFRFLYKK